MRCGAPCPEQLASVHVCAFLPEERAWREDSLPHLSRPEEVLRRCGADRCLVLGGAALTTHTGVVEKPRDGLLEEVLEDGSGVPLGQAFQFAGHPPVEG
ncbi:hypothetical protein, partial [Streptomyces albus]|uniref:hypothetical protein n=1 Tax=Streptomyces sp. NRRL F-5639 TaxID=1463867 RepID=UPI00055DAA00